MAVNQLSLVSLLRINFLAAFIGLSVLACGASVASAQINVPKEIAVGKPIVAGCLCVIPEGAETRVTWGLENLGEGKAEFIGDTGSDFTIYVWAEPGVYRLTLDVRYVQYETIEIPTVDGGTREIKSLVDFDLQKFGQEFTVTGDIPSPKPVPVPGPNPNPNPEPSPVPSDKWGLGQKIYSEAMKVPSEARTKAQSLADNFDAVGAGIAAGQFRNGGSVAAQNELAKRNRETLGADASKWDAAFTELYRHMQEQRVPTTLEGYADAYAYIAKGLRSVR